MVLSPEIAKWCGNKIDIYSTPISFLLFCCMCMISILGCRLTITSFVAVLYLSVCLPVFDKNQIETVHLVGRKHPSSHGFCPTDFKKFVRQFSSKFMAGSRMKFSSVRVKDMIHVINRQVYSNRQLSATSTTVVKAS